MKTKLKLAYIALNALMLWLALGLQFYISTKQYLLQGRTFVGAIIQIVSYYTIQTNILIAIALAAILFAPTSTWGKFFSKVSVLTAIAVYISIVGLIYNLILKGIWELKGLFKLADFLLHTLSPIMFIVFWLLIMPKENIKWKQIFPWALFPLFYLFYSLIRGAINGDYPYPFIDVAKLDYPQVAINSAMVLLAFLVICSCFIGISRVLKKS